MEEVVKSLMNKVQDIVNLKWIHTSDVHGNLFGGNCFPNGRIGGGAMSTIHSYVQEQKEIFKDKLLLTDGGDCLQGHPLVYYYNFIETNTPHLVAEVMNEVGYDCGVMGNHDIEVGEHIFERWMNDCNFPILGANVIDRRTGKPYLKPYNVINRCGIKIAILGMVTPCVPYYQSNSLWPNLRFDDILQSARQWVSFIQEYEHPDLLVGLFHSGFTGCLEVDGICHECSVKEVAEQVPGFDFICYGHDHTPAIHNVVNANGNSVCCVGAYSKERYITELNITITRNDDMTVSKEIDMRLLQITKDVKISKHHSNSLLKRYFPHLRKFDEWAQSPLCKLCGTLKEQDSIVGPSLFMDYIHKLQLDMTNAEISLAAPYSLDTCIKEGLLQVRDIFPLLAFEDFLHTIYLTGAEIKNMLEMSYDNWINTVNSSNERLFKICKPYENATFFKKGKKIIKRIIKKSDKILRWKFVNSHMNLYSAAGIRYTVDVTKPFGSRIVILSMKNGDSFQLSKMYKVAVNHKIFIDMGSILSKGARLSQLEELKRNIYISDKALPYYMMQQMQEQKVVSPKLINNWHFVPEDVVAKAIARDMKLLFPTSIVQELYNYFIKM